MDMEEKFLKRCSVVMTAGILAVFCCGLIPSAVLAQGSSAFASDDFDRHNLDTSRWTFTNPLGDGWVAMVGAGTGDAKLELSVPEGPSHDPYHTNTAVSVMQPCADMDFDVEVKFDSEPAIRFQEQGIIVEQDADNWLRLDVHHDGTDLRIFASRTIGGEGQTWVDDAIASGSAGYLRLLRAGDEWTFYYSSDGATWNEAASFTQALNVSAIGPFVANHPAVEGDLSPAYTAVVDYFFDRLEPIDPEDGGALPDVIEPFIHTVSRSTAADELIVAWYTDEPCLGSVEYGPDTGYGSSVSDVGGIYHHTVGIPGLIPDETIHYRIISDDGLGNIAYSGDYEIIFSPDGPTIDVWYGLDQSFGVLGQPQPWANILGHVSDAVGVASLSYTLNGGSPVTLTIGPDSVRLENSGDFNVDLATGDLVPEPGTNTVVITALDNLSNASTATVTVSYTTGIVWSETYDTDWGSLTADGDPLTPDLAIQDQSQIVDGKWSLNGSSVRTVEPGYDRLIAIGDVLWENYEATVSLTLHDTPGNYGAGLLFRWNGHTDDRGGDDPCSQPHCGHEPLGDIGWFRGSGLDLYKGGDVPFEVSTETLYWLKMRVENNGSGVLYSIKAWEDGASEPVDWMLTNQQDPTTPQAGSLMLITHLADVSFGDVSIEPAPNVPPVANNDVVFVLRGDSADFNILSNDTDSDGTLNPASVTITVPPVNGTIDAIDPVTGIVTYIHDVELSNSDSFIYTVNDNDSETSNPATVDITVVDELPPAFESDDFNSCSLNPRWTFVNTLVAPGDTTVVGTYTDDAQVAISVPAETEHQMFNGTIGVPYIIQTATNTDFTLEVKFDSSVSGDNLHEQGVIIREDDTHWLRMEFYNSGANTMILAARPDNTVPTNISIGVAVIAPLYMRVNRTGNVWTQSYSLDGTTWTAAPGTGFTYAMNVTGVGCYAGNAGTNPAHTALVDYFLNVDEDPIVGEDSARNTLTVNIVGNGLVSKNPDETSYYCDQPVILTATPDGGWQFDGWTGDLESLLSSDTIIMDEPKTVTATFSPQNTVAMDTGAVAPLSTTNLCAVDIPCEITRDEFTDIRLFSVTFTMSNLALCDGLNSISEGDYLSSFGVTQFVRVDNGDGSYTVDGTLLAEPCVGATAATGTLFTVDVANAIPEGDGTGTITITQVVLRDCLDDVIGVAAGAPADIPIDTTPPAPAENLFAQQVLAGNPSGSTTGINLTWTPLADPEAVSVELYRKGFGFWPEYDDDGGSEPTAPQADPEDDGWVHLISLLPADDAHPDTPGGRDYWYYCAVVLDGAGNRSTPLMTDGELNYLLADVSYGEDPPGDGNNKVWTEDISMLGNGYGTSVGDDLYNNVLDVGPTDDNSIFGLPDTDNHVNFEDLMIFSISFGRDFGPIAKQPVGVVESPVPGDRNSLSVFVPELPGPGQTFQVSLMMIGDGQIQGLSIPLLWNDEILEPLDVQAGALLTAQGGTGLALSPQPGTVDVGLMGMRELGISGEGVLAEITCRVLAVGDPGIDLGEVKARSRNNEDIDLVLEVVTELPETPDLPRVTALYANVPNPFNPQTTISFDLAQAGRVRIRIYSLDGRLVKTLVDDVLNSGRYSEVWDGSDRTGRNVASGIYLFRMEAPAMSQTRRMMLLK